MGSMEDLQDIGTRTLFSAGYAHYLAPARLPARGSHATPACEVLRMVLPDCRRPSGPYHEGEL